MSVSKRSITTLCEDIQFEPARNTHGRRQQQQQQQQYSHESDHNSTTYRLRHPVLGSPQHSQRGMVAAC